MATTRPEMIFGDTAICVNPNDDRYKHLIGRRVLVPMSDHGAGASRSVPVIADEYVDVDFGTGALKITPGHDVNDYELGKKHDLEVMNVMNRDATMNAACGPRYAGLDRFDARELLLQLNVTDAELAKRKVGWKAPAPRYNRGVQAKFAHNASSASKGAVLDLF